MSHTLTHVSRAASGTERRSGRTRGAGRGV